MLEEEDLSEPFPKFPDSQSNSNSYLVYQNSWAQPFGSKELSTVHWQGVHLGWMQRDLLDSAMRIQYLSDEPISYIKK